MKLTYFLLIPTFLSCSDQTSNSQKNTAIKEEVNYFSEYLGKFKVTELPLTIKACKIDVSNLEHISDKKFQDFSEELDIAYTKIKTNGNYFATISFSPADCFVPVLSTFSEDGKAIDRKAIVVGYCGSDCGYNCEEFMTINKDFTIYTSDTVSTFECDSIGNIIPETSQNYVIYKKGRLRKDGIIELSEEIKEIF